MTDQLEPQVAEAQATEAAEKPKRQKGETRNGVTIPGEGSKTRLVWDTASAISTEKGRPALSSEVHDALEGQVEKATISTQYNRWCKFYGVSKELSLIHISEPTRLLSISYAVFCLKKKR